MKTFVTLLSLGALLLSASCKNEMTQENTPAYNWNPINVLFVDETGTPLTGLDLPIINGKESGPLELSAYTMTRWINGKQVPNFPDDFRRVLLEQNSPLLRLDGGRPNNLGVPGFLDEYYVFRFTFACPAIYGNDEEHTFVIEKGGRMLGLPDRAYRVLYDDEVIATDLKGRKDPRVPLRIVVKR